MAVVSKKDDSQKKEKNLKEELEEQIEEKLNKKEKENTEKESEKIIEFNKVSKLNTNKIQKHEKEKELLLQEINLEIKRGENIVIYADKTKEIFVDVILGIQKYDTGSLKFFGKEGLGPKVRQKIGSSIIDEKLLEMLTVKDNIEYFVSLNVKDKEKQKEYKEDIIKQLDLENILDKKLSNLSIRERVKVNLACSYGYEPEIYILTAKDMASFMYMDERVKTYLKQISEDEDKSLIIVIYKDKSIYNLLEEQIKDLNINNKYELIQGKINKI